MLQEAPNKTRRMYPAKHFVGQIVLINETTQIGCITAWRAGSDEDDSPNAMHYDVTTSEADLGAYAEHNLTPYPGGRAVAFSDLDHTSIGYFFNDVEQVIGQDGTMRERFVLNAFTKQFYPEDDAFGAAFVRG